MSLLSVEASQEPSWESCLTLLGTEYQVWSFCYIMFTSGSESLTMLCQPHPSLSEVQIMDTFVLILVYILTY